MLYLEKKDDMTPLCPHCNAPLNTVYFKELSSTFGRRYIYFCPACLKTLGISHRKGFFMG